MCDSLYRNGSVYRLTASHRDCIVVKDFERNVRLRGDGLSDRDRPGMVKRAITEVLKNVFPAVEHRARDPVDAFAAHLDESISIAIHPVGHEVTADSRECLRALGYFRRRVVWTARTKIRNALCATDLDDYGTVGQ